jgi:hypothetical protein
MLRLVLISFLVCAAWTAERRVDIGSFGNRLDGWEYYGGFEFPGATGTLARTGESGHATAGAARLSGDFSAGGFYVGMRITKLNLAATGFSCWIKPDGIAKTIGLRLTDEGGQTFQYLIRLATGSDWQRITVLPGTTPAQGHFGGANDGTWKGRLGGAMLMLSKHDCSNGSSGACLVDDITVGVAP